jgi:hypothetical protein
LSDVREWLIRQNFEHERDYFYVGFRHHHWNEPEIVAACPDEESRDDMLREFWKQDAENRFPEYQEAVADMTISELQTERENWIEKLDRLGMSEFQRMMADAASRAPSNDNDKEIER